MEKPTQKEKAKKELSRLSKMIWTPVPAVFQRTMDGRFARHELFVKADWKRVHWEVKKAWGLVPYLQDEEFIYYTEPWYARSLNN